jgi:hypothetical protein
MRPQSWARSLLSLGLLDVGRRIEGLPRGLYVFDLYTQTSLCLLWEKYSVP